MAANKKKVQPPHPGMHLRKEFLEPFGITPHALSLALHVAASRINEIVRGERCNRTIFAVSA